MKRTLDRVPLLSTLAFLAVALPLSHAAEPVTLNTQRQFPRFEQLSEWKHHAERVRRQVAMSCGLWPLPEKTPLNARVFGRMEHPDYSVEKVAIEVHPGVFLGGNLFRPIGKGRGPYPGILNPHGHWEEGRLVNSETGSVFARCIQFARLGMVAFAYDMAGYNDTIQFSPRKPDGSPEFARFYDGHVRYAQDPEDQLWGISLMGLQTWNNIRALDFLESLEDVDKERIAVTGASGGGTQTFILGAVEDRLAAQVPAVMVSHTMQGGCWCENAPGLRVRFSNMDISAAAAPRPQMLVGATGDWTRDTMEFEGPHIQSVYELFGPADLFRFDRFDFPHNYNQTSREAVYAFMAERLLNRAREDALPEQPYQMDRPEDVRVWPDNQLPATAKTREEYKAYLRDEVGDGLAALWPTSAAELESFQAKMRPAYQTVFQLNADPQTFAVRILGSKELPDRTRVSDFELAGWSDTHKTRVRIYQPRGAVRKTVVLSHPLGIAHAADHSGDTFGFAAELLEAGINVVVYDGFLTGSQSDPDTAKLRQPYNEFFTTYNRTDLQEHVADLIGVCGFVRSHLPRTRLLLCGRESSGLWSLLAAPAADGVAADLTRFPSGDDGAWTSPTTIVPMIRRIGTFNGPLLVAAPNPLFIHNTGGSLNPDVLERTFAAIGAAKSLRISSSKAADQELLKWINAL